MIGTSIGLCRFNSNTGFSGSIRGNLTKERETDINRDKSGDPIIGLSFFNVSSEQDKNFETNYEYGDKFFKTFCPNNIYFPKS